MLKLLIAASGSKANATLVIHNGKAVLIDCGTSYKALCDTLALAGLSPASIRAVLVTHSHSDHTKGLATLSKKLSVPMYSGVDICGCERFCNGIDVEGMHITSFACCHDVDCVGYKISADGKTLAVATDTGVITDCILNEMTGCDAVMLECNHDPDMLREGPYPYQLKQRIASREGHLSNGDCAKTIVHLAANGTKKAVLAHLSETNNTPLVAMHTVRRELEKYGFEKNIEIYCADSLTQIEI